MRIQIDKLNLASGSSNYELHNSNSQVGGFATQLYWFRHNPVLCGCNVKLGGGGGAGEGEGGGKNGNSQTRNSQSENSCMPKTEVELQVLAFDFRVATLKKQLLQFVI